MGEMVVLKCETELFFEAVLKHEQVVLNCVPVGLRARNNHPMEMFGSCFYSLFTIYFWFFLVSSKIAQETPSDSHKRSVVGGMR